MMPKSYNLLIDAGNSSVKIALATTDQIVSVKRVKGNPTLSKIKKAIEGFSVKRAIMSSVVDENKELNDWLSDQFFFLKMSPDCQTPLLNDYDSPETLGMDRLAAANAVWRLNPNAPSLSIVSGSCIICDYVSATGHYLGGAISPGLNMRFKAMNHFTDRLPLVSDLIKNKFISDIGTNTHSALQSGALQGANDELQARITRFLKQNSEGKVFLSGGDSHLFALTPKNSIFALPNLVLLGLNFILEFNARQNP